MATISYSLLRPAKFAKELWKWIEVAYKFLSAPNFPGDVNVGGDLSVEGDAVVTGDTTSNKYTLSSPRFEDLQIAVSTARMPAVNAPTWRTFNYGVGGGIAFFTLGFGINDFLEFKIQTTHSMELLTVLDSHIHWQIPSDSVGDKIKFQLDVIFANKFEDYAVLTGSPFSGEATLDGTESGKHNKLDVAAMPAVNTNISTIFVCRLTRVAASSDDYANEVYVDFNDSHIETDTPGGSTTELVK